MAAAMWMASSDRSVGAQVGGDREDGPVDPEQVEAIEDRSGGGQGRGAAPCNRPRHLHQAELAGHPRLMST
jgi:hypothetical protein